MRLRWIEGTTESESGAEPGRTIDTSEIQELLQNFQSPVLLAGWPGIGSVGVGAINYLRRMLDARPVADIDMREYFTAELVLVEEGLARLPDAPTHRLYFVREPTLAIFESESQIAGAPGIELLGQVLDLAQAMEVKTIYTAAAYQYPISHKDDSQALVVANNPDTLKIVSPHEVEILQEGVVSGLNGLLLAFAEQRKIGAACLLATMPVYTHQMPNPKSSREIVRLLAHLLDLKIDMEEIDEAVVKMEASMDDMAIQIQTAMSQMEEDGEPELGQIDEERAPQYVMERIETMFEEVQRDRTQAKKLKEELDRWNLYSFYEDRFLNLFKDSDPNV